jgi:hypothetical protein
MERLGVPRAPAVALGERVVHGWNPAGYAALLGVDYRTSARLTPQTLAGRLDRVLESTQRLIDRFDAERMSHVPPERKRTVRDLAFHVYRVALSFIDAVDRAELPETWFEERAPADLVSGADVARYGALVRAVWHAGQHLRQLYVLAERLGVTAPAPLPMDALDGLPLPEAIW